MGGKRVSAAGVAFVKAQEGFAAEAYADVGGRFAIGYGHSIGPDEELETVTPKQAEALLGQDLAVAEGAVNRLVRVALTQGQFDALVDFAFNVGAGRLAGSTLLARLNRGDYAGAAEEFLRWEYVGDAVSAGLKGRRQAERAVFLEGVNL